MIWGLDVLGASKYGRVLLANWPVGFACGVFSDTFGDSLPFVEKLARTGKCPKMRLHLMWRDAHDYEQQFPAILKEARRVKAVIETLLHVAWEISPACEHRLKKPQALALMRQCRDIFGATATIVNCPWEKGGGASVKEFKNETHGTSEPKKGPYNYSWDGTSCVDADVTESKAFHEDTGTCDTYYFWEPRFNGRWESNDNTPRPERKGWPDAQFIASVVALASKRGRVKLPDGWLLKSHAENKGNGDPRAEMPVFICPVKTKKIELRAGHSGLVATAPYFGPYIDGRHRYYFPDWGYKLAEKAVAMDGSPLCKVVVDGEVFGTVTPAFRAGSFRNENA